MDARQSLDAIKQNIEKWQKKSPLAATDITLVAVSKAQPKEAVLSLIEAGQRVFGENRVQEAQEKWVDIRKLYPDVQLHLIGSLQTNKVKQALSLFDVMHTVDRPSLADAIVKEMAKFSGVRCKTFFVQVNIGEEEQKGGVNPKDLPELLRYIQQAGRALPPGAFSISGLMCVPPAEVSPAPYFALLHKMAQEHTLPFLSMGMSSDYETAIRLGATHIRIGTALFGERAKL